MLSENQIRQLEEARQVRIENPPHGHARKGFKTPTYRSWVMMRSRCNNEKGPSWEYYGGRGIVVCARWSNFAAFLEDMGERPPGTTLDRIDCNGNYEPGNCRWASSQVQNQNKRRPQKGKAAQDACVHGHPFTPENTKLRSNGTRECRECARARSKARRSSKKKVC